MNNITVLCVRIFYSETGWQIQRMILSLRIGITLVPGYNDFGYYEHLGTMSNYFSVEKLLLID